MDYEIRNFSFEVTHISGSEEEEEERKKRT